MCFICVFIVLSIPSKFFDIGKVHSIKKHLQKNKQQSQTTSDTTSLKEYDEENEREGEEDEEDEQGSASSGAMKNVNRLLNNKPFVFLVLSNTVLFFVVSGIQYWATYYFVNVLSMT